MTLRIDLVGRRYGRLEVLSEWGRNKFGRIVWLCRCECGNAATAVGNILQRGEATSCGCHLPEMYKRRVTTHGQAKTGLYHIWSEMKRRCLVLHARPYKYYGGRGITVCDAWRDSFEQFAADMGERPPGMTLERKDNNGPYAPGNCVWASRTVQARNTRRNKYYLYEGARRTLAEWSMHVGIPDSALYYRIVTAKWDMHRALYTPSVVGGNKPQHATSTTLLPSADHHSSSHFEVETDPNSSALLERP